MLYFAETLNEFPTSEFFLRVKNGHIAIADRHFEEFLALLQRMA
jgi:hypothetical protein